MNDNIKRTVVAFYKKTSASGPVDPSLSISSEKIAVGATTTISAPEELTVSYESSNKNIATVSTAGVVTGVAAGEATITASWDATDTYNAGSKQFTVTVVEATTYEMVTSTDQLVVGNEYILVAMESSVAMGAQNNNIRNYVGVTIIGDEIAITDEAVAVLTLGGSTGAWTLLASDNSKYLALTSSSNEIHASDDASLTTSQWVINDNFELQNANFTDRYLRYNYSSPRFACYTSAQKTSVLFVKSGSSVNTKADAELAFSATSINVNVGEGENFEAPTLSTAAGFDGSVTYSYVSSNEENVVVLDETTGDILIEANAEGTITVTATSAETDNFKAGTASYTITIVDNREEADLAWSSETVEIEQGATEYTLPTLSNPNNVTVTYSSDNEDIAIVDETTGEVVVETGEVGTAKITATFAGNASYKAASVSYTITIIEKETPIEPVNGYYLKVTSTDDITDGQYLIVYEGNDDHDAVYFDGSLETLDAANNGITVTIEDDMIAATTVTRAAEFTIDVTAGTLKSASGYYIGKTAYSNGLDAKSEILTNTFEINEGEAVITAEGGCTLRYNYASDQLRFRYYKSGQQAIQLYKFVAIEPESITASVSEYKWATFSSEYALDFTDVEGVEAHIVTGANGSTIVTEKVEGTVASNTGLLLYSKTAGDYDIPVAEEGEDYSTTNKLIAVTKNNTTITKATDGTTNYVLTVQGDKAVFAYINSVDATLNKGQAYLNLDGEELAPVLSFDGADTTSLKDVQRMALDAQQYFDLSGRRVAEPTKGVYILNGRKVIIK